MIKKNSNSGVKISVVIVTYNSENYLKACFNSIQNSNLIDITEIIVIDNNSVDNTQNLIKEFEYDIKFILNTLNIGFAAACNQGIDLSKGEYIFVLNPDTILLNDSLSIFYNFMENYKNIEVWCVGAQLYDEKNKPLKSFNNFPSITNVITEQLGIKGLLLKIPFIYNSVKYKKLNSISAVSFVMGCDMFIRKTVLDEIGLFNDRFFLNYEETELSWRAKKAGYRSIIHPEATIIHYSGKSFTDLKSYLSHLWYGQLMFFKLTQSRSKFYIAKVFHLLGAFFRVVIKLDKFYWFHLKKIWSIK